MLLRKTLGIIFAVLAVAGLISSIRTVMTGPSVVDPSGLGVSYAVGAFPPTMLFTISALWLLRRKSPRA